MYKIYALAPSLGKAFDTGFIPPNRRRYFLGPNTDLRNPQI